MCGVLWRNGTVPRQLIILSGGTQRGKKEVINQDHSVQHCLIKYWSLKGKLELLFTDKGHCTEVKAQTFCFYVCCVIAVCVLKYLLPQTCKGVVLLYISRSFTEFYWGGFCCRCNLSPLIQIFDLTKLQKRNSDLVAGMYPFHV